MLAAGLAVGFPGERSVAIEHEFTGNASRRFDNSSNWSPSGVPGDGDIAYFPAVSQSGRTPNITTTERVDELHMDGGARLYNTFGTGLLRIDDAIDLFFSGTARVDADITVNGDDFKIRADSDEVLHIAGEFTDGSSSYEARVLEGGRVDVSGGISVHQFSVENGSTLRLLGGNNLSLDTKVYLSSTGNLDVNGFTEAFGNLEGAGDVSLGGGHITIGENDEAQVDFGGRITGNGTVTKKGTGIWRLTGGNTVGNVQNTGGLIVEGGSVELASGEIIGTTVPLAIGSGGTVLMTGAAETIGSLAGSGTLNLNGRHLTFGGNSQNTSFSGSIDYGAGGQLTKVGSGTFEIGEIEVDSGGTLNVNGGAVSADEAGTNGLIVVNGAGSQLTVNAAPLRVGFSSPGSMEIKNGGQVLADGARISRGNLLVDGGTLDAGNGSFLISPALGGEGTATVANAGQILNVNELAIAQDASDGSLFLRSGGTVEAESAIVGGRGTTTLISKSKQACSGSGFARFCFSVQWTETEFDPSAGGGTGTVSLAGSGTTLGATDMVVGLVGDGMLNVDNGAVVNIAHQLAVAETGAVNLNGGSINIGNVSQPAETDTIRVGAEGVLSGKGVINGDVIVETGGVFLPGASPGTLTIDGNLSADEDALLVIEINGTAPGQFDLVEILGDATISGLVVFDFGFAPSADDAFEFLAITGAIAGDLEFGFAGLEDDFEFETISENGVFTMTALSDGILVPEPSSFALAALGCAALAVFSWRRRKP